MTQSKRIIVLAFSLSVFWVGHGSQAQSRTDVIEAARTEKEAHLTPYAPNKGERIIDKDGSGQPRDGIRPIGPMRETWERLLAEGSGLLDLRPVAPSYLATFGERLLRWDIPESRVYTTSEN